MRKILLTVLTGLLVTSIPVAFAVTAFFNDVPTKSWYTNAVYNLKDKGIVAGYNDGTFRP